VKKEGDRRTAQQITNTRCW